MHVPDLGLKLQALYARDNLVDSDVELARVLSVRLPNFDLWRHGAKARRPNLLPDHHVDDICNTFQILPAWLEIDSLEQFHELLRSEPLDRSPWQQLTLAGITSSALELVRRPSEDVSTRGLAYVEDEFDSRPDAFRTGERVYIRLTLPEMWHPTEVGARVSLTLFVADRHRVVCLCPSRSSIAPAASLGSSVVTIPVHSPGDYLTVSEPRGKQRLIALLTRTPISEPIVELLMDDHANSGLDDLAQQVNCMPRCDWQVLVRVFEVY